jgi:hypothetical protein
MLANLAQLTIAEGIETGLNQCDAVRGRIERDLA